VAPDGDGVRAAAEILNAGERVAILIGQGARGARAEVMEVADLLGAGVAKALLGKDVLSDELPYVTGSIGLLGTRPSYELMRECDTLLMIGTSFPYSQFLPEYGSARGVQIDDDAGRIGMRYPNELNLVGDAALTLRALIPQLNHKEDQGWRERIEQGVAEWWETMAAESAVEAEPINPMRIFSEASPLLPPDCIVTSDSGSASNWYARQLRFRGDMRGSVSGTLATMGAAVPYGIGAKFGCPDRPVVAFMGDGAMQMNGMAELLTIARYWRDWDDARLITVVLHNNDLNEVTWELRAMGASPRFVESQALPEVSYADFAHSVGLLGITVREPGELAGAWQAVFAAERPAVLDVYCDPNVPPIPPHSTLEQAMNTARALIAGDANRWGVVKQGIKTKAQELLPARGRE
jgi:pyruvate dehydrogenase (quinone)